MLPRVTATFLALMLAGSAARAQVNEVSSLWREWATLEAEWRAERKLYGGERLRQRAIREALGTGRDPRETPARAPKRPAGPGARP